VFIFVCTYRSLCLCGKCNRYVSAKALSAAFGDVFPVFEENQLVTFYIQSAKCVFLHTDFDKFNLINVLKLIFVVIAAPSQYHLVDSWD